MEDSKINKERFDRLASFPSSEIVDDYLNRIYNGTETWCGWLSRTNKMLPMNFVLGQWISTTNNLEEEEKLEEKLNKFLEEKNIEVDKDGNFEMYVVVDADDTEHEVGSIHCGQVQHVYTKEQAFKDLKNCNFPTKCNYSFANDINIKKQTTIKEDLMTMEDKMFKILVNKENVYNFSYVVLEKEEVLCVKKYKVIDSVSINPELKFKIIEIGDSIMGRNTVITVLLYNSITENKRTILMDLDYDFKTSITQIEKMINDYLKLDEHNVALINSTVDNGISI